ncbi:MAG: hypothetical protein SFU83_01160 [Meiothermus sp.]|nr:hypothetical protein [Meiothermus sp.]
MEFVLVSYTGAKPILFGSSRDEMDKILGRPTWEQRGGRHARYGGHVTVIVEFDIKRQVEFIQTYPNNWAIFARKNLLQLKYGAAEQLLKDFDPNAANDPKNSVGVVSHLLGGHLLS